MPFDPLTMALACIAAIAIGLGKGGLYGLGTMATPFLALVLPPLQAAAILLPILMVGDVVSVWMYRKTWNRWITGWILPGACLGVVLGYFFAASVPTAAVTGALGAITAGFALYRLWIERRGRIVASSNSPGWVGSLFGVALGFTSHVAHAGGPPFQIWVMPRQLPHLEFVGTSAVVFAIVNLVKLPAYAALGEFSAENVQASAMLAPLAAVSTLAGVWIVRRFDPTRFYTFVYWLMILLGAKLMWDGVAG